MVHGPAALAEAAGDAEDVTVIHGDNPRGADMMADCEAKSYGFRVEPHPASWDKHGKAAGHIRNQEMVDTGADVCLAFYVPGLPCAGTRDCDQRATKAGIPVTRIGAS